MNISSLFGRSILGLLSALIFTTGCDLNSNSKSDYVYKNPDKGGEVQFKETESIGRLSEAAKAPAPTEKKSVRVYDGRFEVDLKTRVVSFRVKKDSPDGETVKTEDILLTGTLDAKYKGWIKDSESQKLSGVRAYAYVSCFPDSKGNFCATSYVSVRYVDENGDEQEKQFHQTPPVRKKKSSDKNADAKKDKDKSAQTTTETESTPAPSTPKVEVIPPKATPDKTPQIVILPPSPAPSAPAPGLSLAPPTTMPKAPQLPTGIASDNSGILTFVDDKEYTVVKEKPIKQAAPAAKGKPEIEGPDLEEGELDDEEEDEDLRSGPYISPSGPDDLKDLLIGKKKTPKKNPNTPSQVVGTDPQTTLGIPLNLSEGGISLGKPGPGGSIRNGTLLPKSGAGYVRHSPDKEGHGGGFFVSFLQNSARRFALDNPQCGEMHINDLSLRLGGKFGPHKGHRNGTEADISYFGKAWDDALDVTPATITNKRTGKRQRVMMRTLSDDFKTECFLKYLKFLDDQKFANVNDDRFEGHDIVELVFVNQAVHTGICEYVKNKKLVDTYGDALNLLYPLTSNHNKHFHLRMRCSPKHIGCRDSNLDRIPPFRKRGCKF